MFLKTGFLFIIINPTFNTTINIIILLKRSATVNTWLSTAASTKYLLPTAANTAPIDNSILEEKSLRGETLLHSDRFLPHFKMFYTPFKIEKYDAPFQYAIGSHKINEDYINFFLKSKYFDETDEGSLKLIKKLVTVTTDENTLYIAFTNGLHKRSAFTKENSERFMMFFQYVERFNKFNYLFN